MTSIQDLLIPYKTLEIPTTKYSIPSIQDAFISLENSPSQSPTVLTERAESTVSTTPTKFSWIQSNLYIPTQLTSSKLIPRTQLNTNGWNLQASLDRLNAKAGSKSKHLCAGYIWDALAAGGLRGMRGHARDVVKSGTLEANGFKPISRFKDSNKDTTYTPQAGDIVVSAPDNNKSTSGHHIAMYNGNLWVSDFKLSNLDVYDKKDNEWIIYRRTV